MNKKYILRPVALALIPMLLNACASYQLSDKKPQFLISKSKEATKGVCGVAPFRYEPVDTGDKKLMTQSDRQKWDDIFYDAINIADICGRTVKVASPTNVPKEVNYLIDGKVTDFYFKKNWVPMFFPGWMGLTFITLGVYGIAAGPTTSTKGSFGFTTTLKDPKSGQILESIQEEFQSTDVMTIYSDENLNPYQNPGLAFEPTLNDLSKKLGEGIARAEERKKPPALSQHDQLIRQLGELRESGVLTEQEYVKKIDALSQ